LQFSLFTLFAVIVAVCLVAAWYGEKMRRVSAEQATRERDAEIRELRVILGILDDRGKFLTVDDKKKVHIRFIPVDELHWRWQVFLPPGTAWDIDTSQGEYWSDETQCYTGGGGGTELDLTGEFTIDARVSRSLDGRFELVIRQGRSEMHSTLQESGVALLRSKGTPTRKVTGGKGQETFEPTGQILLLRWQNDKPPDPNTPEVPVAGERSPTSFGISIRLEEQASKQARFQKKRSGIP
jgi:hypothetical protein